MPESHPSHTSPHSPAPAHALASPAPGNGRKIVVGILAALLILGSAGGFWYWQQTQKYIYTDKASLSAPVINLTPQLPGTLKDVMVSDGATVMAHQAVARVGSDLVTSDIDGIILKANQDIGATYQSGQTVVTMIDPREMRVVARVEEDKGLKDISVGKPVRFTVDAYGSQEFQGDVESISQTSREGDVVFNISDKRQEQEFEVKIAYDINQNPSFKNGMSAKVWITK